MARGFFAEAVYKKAKLHGTEFTKVGFRLPGGHGFIASMRLGESDEERVFRDRRSRLSCLHENRFKPLSAYAENYGLYPWMNA